MSENDGRVGVDQLQLGKASRNRKFQLRDVRGFHMGWQLENIFVAHLGVPTIGASESEKDEGWWEKVVQLGKVSRNRKFQLRDGRGVLDGKYVCDTFVWYSEIGRRDL